MSIKIIEVANKQQIKQFVQFQFDLYQHAENWVPSIFNDEVKALIPYQNPALEFSKAKYWLAEVDGKIAGRIGAIVNDLYNQKTGEKKGRFSRFECINNPEVASKLFETAERWLKEQGMTAVHGPLGFTNLDNQGMLIEGFEYLQSVGSVYHQPYYREIIENLGYVKENDWIEFRLTICESVINKANRGAQMIMKRYGIEVVHFKKISELLPYNDFIFSILNNSFDELPYVMPFNRGMIEFYKDKYIKLLNPEFVKMAKINNEIVGFIIGMPSLSVALQKAKGKLFPFGFIPILKAKKGNTDTLEIVLTGVLKEHQATGAAVVLMAELQNIMASHHIKYIETTGIFETNHHAIANWKNYEHIQHKRRRCFVKEL